MARTAAAAFAAAVALSANVALACDQTSISAQTQNIETVCCQGQGARAVLFLLDTAPFAPLPSTRVPCQGVRSLRRVKPP